MIYEMRIYHCMPGRLPDVMKRFETVTLGLWEKMGIRQGGFFTTLVRDSNQDLTYFLVWESLARREKLRPAFLIDPEWIAARTRTEANGPLVSHITNQFLQPTTFSVAN